MFSLSKALLKKDKVPVFSGMAKVVNMADKRLARKPGNPIRKYPYYGCHSLTIGKKYICEDLQNPNPNESLAHFMISYRPMEDSLIADKLQTVLKSFLPGCKVSLDPIPLSKHDFASLRVVRLTDNRVIFATGSVDEGESSATLWQRFGSDIFPMMTLQSSDELLHDLSNMQRFIEYAQAWK